MASLLTADMVREYLQDYPDANLLLDDIEFSDTYINLCKKLAVSEFNAMSPMSNITEDLFPSLSLLLSGTCWQIFQGRATLKARNDLQYSDGGLTVPVEEKYQLYAAIAASFQGTFMASARQLKTNLNMENGWSFVFGDETSYPLW